MNSTGSTSLYSGFSVIALSFLSVFSTTSLLSAATDGKNPVLVPYRAIYDLTLDKASGRSGIVAIEGSMDYAFVGNKCEGYTASLSMVTKFTDKDNQISQTDVGNESWESGDGNVFQFLSRSFLNKQITQATQGSAKGGVNGKQGTYKLDIPTNKKSKMPHNTLFPTVFLEEVLKNARQGNNVFEALLFDGSYGGRVYKTTTFIGREKPPGTNELTGKILKQFDDIRYIKARKLIQSLKSWPIKTSYFEGKSDAEETPLFEFAFDVFDNGVISKILIDYGTFSMKGKLNSLKLFDRSEC